MKRKRVVAKKNTKRKPIRVPRFAKPQTAIRASTRGSIYLPVAITLVAGACLALVAYIALNTVSTPKPTASNPTEVPTARPTAGPTQEPLVVPYIHKASECYLKVAPSICVPSYSLGYSSPVAPAILYSEETYNRLRAVFPETPTAPFDAKDDYYFFFFPPLPITKQTLELADATMRQSFVEPTLAGTKFMTTFVRYFTQDVAKSKAVYILQFFETDASITSGAPFTKYNQQTLPSYEMHYLYSKEWTEGKVCEKTDCPFYVPPGGGDI